MNTRRLILLAGGPILFLAFFYVMPLEGLSVEARAVLSGTLWIAVWWISEVVPIPVTSLLPIIIFPLTGAMSVSDTTSSYGHKFVFLYIGGFILAKAIERWDLHKRIALNTIHLVGTDSRRVVLGFMVATAFLSMWISNTATSVMMLPIALAVVRQLQKTGSAGKPFGKALMLGIAYAASIGGFSTLIGTPPNLVLAGVVKDYYGREVVFSEWILLVLPLSVLLLVIAWQYLTRVAFRLEKESSLRGKEEISSQLRALGKWSYEEWAVLAVFMGTGFLWMTRSFLLDGILPFLDDTIIGIAAAVLLFIIPGRKKKVLLDWDTAVKIPWGIALLFGGGLAVAKGFKETGLAEWIGAGMVGMSGLDVFVILLVVVAMVNFLTEITSNVATTSMILPVLSSVALAVDIDPFVIMVGATISASCAFMLPVATPPNAVVFGAGYLRMSDMVKTGLVLNLISILLVSIYIYIFLPLIWT